MGMYDSIFCSKDLGPGFHKKEVQTKDLDCLMNEYWIDPEGKLWIIDYAGTQMFETDSKDRIRVVKSGSKGVIRPVTITQVIEVYPVQWTCQYAPYPRLHLVFVGGILKEVINTTRCDDAPLTDERSY